LSGVENPSFIIDSEIDWRFLRVAVLVADIGITRLTNLDISVYSRYGKEEEVLT